MFNDDDSPVEMTFIERLFLFLVTLFLILGIGFFGEALYSKARAADAPTVNLCTGGEGNPYHRSGVHIGKFTDAVKVSAIPTEGTWDNIERTLAGTCDAYIGQPDGTAFLARKNPGAVKQLRKVATLHREYVHVVCSVASGVDDLSNLEDDPKAYSVALGKEGSGAWLFWQNVIAEDEDYAAVPTTPESGIIALTSVSTNQTTCAVVTAGLGNKLVTEANATFSGDVALVSAQDGDFNDAQDIDGSALYEFVDLPYAYDNLQGFWDVETLSWRASVYINTDAAVFQNEANLAAFLTAVARAKPSIVAEFGN